MRNRVTGNCLRRLRREAGLTQQELAERMNTGQSFISKVENAERELKAYEIFSYSAALDCDYTVFVTEVHTDLSEAGLLS